MKTLSFLVTILLILSSCTRKKESVEAEVSKEVRGLESYGLVSIGNGILVEDFDSSINAERINDNNKIFKVGSSFTYSFEYLDPSGVRREFVENREGSFVPKGIYDSSSITKIKILVKPGIINSNQTKITYTYLPKTYSLTSSGIIENSGNVWMHPPRDYLFKILELNPFPFIGAPYEIGNKWTWELLIGQQYGDVRWATWTGNITNHYNYQIIDRLDVESPLGQLECFVIYSEAESQLGKTSLKAYFNEEHGFVKLSYVNIDGSIINMNLIERATPETMKLPYLK